MRKDENRVVSYFSEEEGYSMARTGRISGVRRGVMAERVGFEPTIPVKVCPLSRRIVSTTHAPLRVGQIELLAPHRSWPELSVLRAKTIRAQDFACGLPLRFTPANRLNFNHSRTSPRRTNCCFLCLYALFRRHLSRYLSATISKKCLQHFRAPPCQNPASNLNSMI